MTDDDDYPFHLVNYDTGGPLADPSVLQRRPFITMGGSFEEDARRFVPDPQLEIAINTAIAVGEPLLVTGEPGTGKTQVAYYTAYKLGIEPVLHFQVKSDSGASDLLYHFDTVRYFHDATMAGRASPAPGPAAASGGPEADAAKAELPDKSRYVEPRPLWEAITSDRPRVLLIDEIDKAPRDFPNDLLHEIDKLEFTVVETGQVVRGDKGKRPVVFITSNSERRLPEPFLRRCVYHNIRLDEGILNKAVENRRDEYKNLSREFLGMAMQRFLALRERPLRKHPSTAELLVWLRVLSLTAGTYPEQLDSRLSNLPHIGVLLKDHLDIDELDSQT